MKRAPNAARQVLRALALGARNAIRNVTGHWALALFSLVAAFGVWVAVQDVDNPRVEGIAPASGGVEVRALNASDDVIVAVQNTVKVEVEAREDDLADLTFSDFIAEVDVSGISLGDAEQSVVQDVPVRVRSLRQGVRVIGSVPPRVSVSVLRAATKELPVTVVTTGQPPDGYQVLESPPPVVEPAIVTVRGPANRVAAVARVELQVNLAGVRDRTELKGELVARSESGNAQGVTLSDTSARVTIRVEPIFSQRVMLLNPVIVGTPAPGFQVVGFSVDPPTVLASGEKAVIDGLVQKLGGSTASVAALNLERIDVTNARQDITQSKQIEKPANVATDRQTVVVKVEIRPVVSTASLIVAPTVDGQVPAGMIIENAIITTTVRVSGQAAAIQNLKPGDVKATFSLAGAAEGQGTYQVKATAPAGITIESAEAVSVTLRTVPTP